MTDKQYIKQQKLICQEDAEKHLATLSGEWKAKVHKSFFADSFNWEILSKCKRVTVIRWLENTYRSKMGCFSSTGKTIKSSIRNLKKVAEQDLALVGAKFVEPFPKF